DGLPERAALGAADVDARRGELDVFVGAVVRVGRRHRADDELGTGGRVWRGLRMGGGGGARPPPGDQEGGGSRDEEGRVHRVREYRLPSGRANESVCGRLEFPPPAFYGSRPPSRAIDMGFENDLLQRSAVAWNLTLGALLEQRGLSPQIAERLQSVLPAVELI